jgi:hypothetical protein
MTTFYVSFPIKDAQRRDSFTTLDAPDEIEARLRVIEHYGRDGFFTVTADPNQIGVERYNLAEIGFGQ